MSDTSFVLVVGMTTFFILATLISGWPHQLSHDLRLSHDLTQLSHDLHNCHMTSPTVTWLHPTVTWPHPTVTWPHRLSHDLTTVTWPHTTVTWPHTTVTWPHNCHMTSHNCHMASQLSHDLTQMSHDLTKLSHDHPWSEEGYLEEKKENSDNSCCYEKSIVWFLVFWEMWTENWWSVPSCYTSLMIYHCGGEPEQAVHCWFNVMALKPWICVHVHLIRTQLYVLWSLTRFHYAYVTANPAAMHCLCATTKY